MLKRIFLFTLLAISCSFASLNATDMADSHIYKGRYTNFLDIIYTFDGKHLYSGRYTNFSDIMMTFDTPVPVPIMIIGLL